MVVKLEVELLRQKSQYKSTEKSSITERDLTKGERGTWVVVEGLESKKRSPSTVVGGIVEMVFINKNQG